MANNGTLFLDEIGEISPKMQVNLLRVLEEKKFYRLGGNQPDRCDFRLVSATHRDLRQLLREEQFREDFFYRINVLTIHIPPLRERLEDVPVLADFFLQKYARETGKPVEGLTPRAVEILMEYSWPGNVRELRNVIERVVVIARGRMIGAEELAFLHAYGDSCQRHHPGHPQGNGDAAPSKRIGKLQLEYHSGGKTAGHRPGHSLPEDEAL
jgi:transcriptional regulator with PAS, ATPase and Fis domain